MNVTHGKISFNMHNARAVFKQSPTTLVLYFQTHCASKNKEKGILLTALVYFNNVSRLLARNIVTVLKLHLVPSETLRCTEKDFSLECSRHFS